MNFNLNPSLVHISVVNIAIEMWKHSDARQSMTNFKSLRRGCIRNGCEVIESTLLEKVTRLELPKKLQTRVKTAIKPVGNEMLEYCFGIADRLTELSESCQDKSTCCLDYFCWTPFGTIDKKKTAESFLKKEIFSVRWRYLLACEYICEDYIPILWNELPDCEKELVLHRVPPCEDYFEEYYMVDFLTCGLIHDVKAGDLGKKPFEYFTVYSIKQDNVVSFGCFWDKMSAEERVKNVVVFAKFILNHRFFSVPRSVILIFLLSKMNEEQLSGILESHTFRIINYLFNSWLTHDLFLPIVKSAWDLISGKNYGLLLELTCSKMNQNEWDAQKYQNWLFELWIQSPTHLKKYFIEHPSRIYFYLVVGNKFDCIKLILRDTPVSMRKCLISSFTVKDKLRDFMWKNRWELLDKLVEYLLSCNEQFPLFMNILVRDYLLNCGLSDDEKWVLFDMLLSFSDSSSKQEVDELKRQVVYLEGKKICKYLECSNKFLLIDEFLVWGLGSSEEEIIEFKKCFSQ